MGLDITGYMKLKEDATADPKNFDYTTHARFYGNRDFPNHMGEHPKPDVMYTFADSYGFRAGSYSGYNMWRGELANLVGVNLNALWNDPNPAPGPFRELLNFSDCEGTIGTEMCKKLHQDFLHYRAAAEEHSKKLEKDEGAWFYDRYKQWMRVFEMGAHDGAVDFH